MNKSLLVHPIMSHVQEGNKQNSLHFYCNMKTEYISLERVCEWGTGGVTPCQFVHHVRAKLATPILHVIDRLNNCDIFSTYI